MSLCDDRALFANDKEVPRRRSGAASRGNDAAIHKKRRLACRRINQWFLNASGRKIWSFTVLYESEIESRLIKADCSMYDLVV